MDPVLREVGHEEEGEDLSEEWQAGDEGRETRGPGPVEEDHGRLHGEQGRDLDQERGHEEVGEVGPKAPAHDGLVRIAREEPLERQVDR